MLTKLPRLSLLRPLSKEETPVGWRPLRGTSMINLVICYMNLFMYFIADYSIISMMGAIGSLIIAIGSLAIIKYRTQQELWETIQNGYANYDGGIWDDDDGSNSAGP